MIAKTLQRAYCALCHAYHVVNNFIPPIPFCACGSETVGVAGLQLNMSRETRPTYFIFKKHIEHLELCKDVLAPMLMGLIRHPTVEMNNDLIRYAKKCYCITL